MPCARPPVKEELPSSRNRHRLPLPSVFERQFDSAGHRNTLFPRHCSPMAISLSTVTGTQLIAAFARFSGIRVKVSAAIHTVCWRVRARLTLCLCGIRNDRNYRYRNASNQAHGNLPRARGRRAIQSKDRRPARLRLGQTVGSNLGQAIRFLPFHLRKQAAKAVRAMFTRIVCPSCGPVGATAISLPPVLICPH